MNISKFSRAMTAVKKVFPYTFIHWGVPVGEDTYPEPSACEVGWPVTERGPLNLQFNIAALNTLNYKLNHEAAFTI